MAKQPTTLELRRREARHFLSTELLGAKELALDAWKLPHDGIVVHAPYEYHNFKKLIDFHFTPDMHIWWNYQRELHRLKERTIEYVLEENKKGIVPAFVFLRTETNWQKTGRIDRNGEQVNLRGGAKQLLANKYRNIFFDQRYLSFHELAVREVMKGARNPVHIPTRGKGIYKGELSYYREPKNDDAGALVVYTYSDLEKEMEKFQNVERCPNIRCSLPYTTVGAYTHEGCKSQENYQLHAIQRSNAFEIKFMKRIASLSTGIDFTVQEICCNGKELYIATPNR